MASLNTLRAVIIIILTETSVYLQLEKVIKLGCTPRNVVNTLARTRLIWYMPSSGRMIVFSNLLKVMEKIQDPFMHAIFLWCYSEPIVEENTGVL